ncbi:reverse transcriptase domain-containing protein [Tanacetum coccineum]
MLMTYLPLQLEGLPFELEWDPLPNCTKRSSNSFEWCKIIFVMITSIEIRHAKTLTLRGEAFDETRENVRLVQTPVTTTVFAATTHENTPFAYRASNSANPNPMISPDFAEANYEVLESLLREQRRQIRNEDLRTELEYFSEDCDEEREMGPRPGPTRETTPPFQSRAGRNAEGSRPLKIETRENESRGMNLPPLLAAHLGRNESGQPLQSSLTSVYGGYQPTTNTGGNLPPDGTLLSHHAQPFIPNSLHIPTGFVPTHVNPYTQPSAGIVNGQPLSFAFQAQNGNPSAGPIIHKGIDDYPLLDGLKMPSHIGSYDGKGDPDNFLHLFESQQKKFTKTHLAVRNIKQREGETTRAFATRYTDDTLQILGLHVDQRISGFVHCLRTRSLVATNGAPSDRRENFERSKKSSWDNNRGQKGRDMFSPYRGPNHGLLSSLSKSPREIITTEKVARSFEQPPRMFGSRRSQDMSKYCHFHEDHGHKTNDCHQLRSQIEEAIKSGQLSHLVKGIKKERAKASKNERDNTSEDFISEGREITFPSVTRGSNFSAPVIIKAKIFGREVGRVHMNSGSSYEVIYEHCFMKLKPFTRASKIDSKVPLIGFLGEKSWSSGEIPLEITIGDPPLTRRETLNFVIVRSDLLYNMLLGRKAMHKMGIVVSTIHEAIKFHTAKGIENMFSTYESDKVKEGMKKVRETPPTSKKGVFSCTKAEEKVVINDKFPEQTVTIGKQLPEHFKERLRDLLRSNADVFAWTHTDMMMIPRTIMIEGKPFKTEHELDEYNHIKPIKQKRRGLGPDRNTAACKEVEELMKAGILWKAKHQTWVANPIMVKKSDGGLRMCVDFTDINKSCPKDYYPLPEIDWKNAGATYQRLVDKVFHDQIGRNLEAYVDDMVIKSTSEEDMLADIKETLESCTDKKHLQWTQEAEATLQEINKFMKDLPTLTTPIQGEVLIMYLSTSTESISADLFAKRKEEQKRGDDKKEMPKDFLIEVPFEDSKKEAEGRTNMKSENTKLSYEWKLYTDGAASSDGSGAGLVLIDPKGKEYTYALRFGFETTNNEAKYEALLAELRIAQDMEIYLIRGLLPKDLRESRKIRVKAPQYKLIRGSLYQRSFYTSWLRCVASPQTKNIVKEIHEGSYGFNAKPCSMVVRITKQGYYWPSMHRDAAKVIQDCEKCKEQSAIRKAAENGAITARNRWPFSHWGVNILRPLPTAPKGLKFLAIAVEHSTK